MSAAVPLPERTNNDLGSPPEFLEHVYALAPIGLDPCSNRWSVVQAQVAFTEEDDGLAQSWQGYGLVYVNPPYGRGHMIPWSVKIVEEALAGAEIVTLLKGDYSTDWWELLREYAAAICYVRKRVSFLGGNHGSGNFPSAVFYFGPRPEEFAAAFAGLGDVRILG